MNPGLSLAALVLAIGPLRLGSPDSRGAQVATLSCEQVVPPSDSGAGRVVSLGVGADGRLAWTDGRPGQALVRDVSGRVRVIGRSGAGPGEFARITALGWLGDTLWVHDASNSRVQFFADSGTYLTGVRLPARVGWAPRPAGHYVGFAFQLARPTPDPIGWLAARADATSADTLARFERVEGDPVLVPAGGREIPNPHPLLARTVVGASAAHDRACAAIPADGSTTTLRCVDDRGRIVLDKRLDLSPRPVTDAIYDSVITIFSRAPGRTPAIMRDRISRPRSLPPVAALLVSSDGSLWLQRSHQLEHDSHWMRVRTDGTVRDSLVLPPSTRLLEVDGEVAWAAIADADGLESLASCRVTSRLRR
jgi:hypothetical protein